MAKGRIIVYNRLDRWLGYVDGTLATVAMVLIMVMIFMVTADVALRYGFNSGVWGPVELSEHFLVAIIFLSLASTERMKGHVIVELFSSKLSGKALTSLLVFGNIITVGLLALLFWQSILTTVDSINICEMTYHPYQIWVSPFRAIIAIGVFAYMLRCVLNIIGIYTREHSNE